MPIAREALDDRAALAEHAYRDGTPPLQAAVKAHMGAIDKLTTIVAQLEDRLDPVRVQNRTGQEDQDTSKPLNASRLVMDLNGCTEGVVRLQRRIDTLLAELEV